MWMGFKPFKSGWQENAVTDARERIRKVIDELIEIGDLRAVEHLIKLAEKRRPNGTCKEWPFPEADWAIEALGNFNNKKSIDYLVKALEDKDRDIRTAAAKALDKLGWNQDD